jgi:hypothetical protein
MKRVSPLLVPEDTSCTQTLTMEKARMRESPPRSAAPAVLVVLEEAGNCSRLGTVASQTTITLSLLRALRSPRPSLRPSYDLPSDRIAENKETATDFRPPSTMTKTTVLIFD